MVRYTLVKQAVEALIALDRKIETNNKLSMFDENTLAEDYYARLYTFIFCAEDNSGYYYNLNKLRMNYPAIDLSHSHKKECVQVTSNLSKDKVRKTIEMFLKHKLENEYDHLIIQGISEKKTKELSDIKYPNTLKVTLRNRTDIIIKLNEIDEIDNLKLITEFLGKETYSNPYNEDKNFKLRLLMVTPYSMERSDTSYSFDDDIYDFFNREPFNSILEPSFVGSLTDLTQELIANAFEHGEATKFKVEITKNEIKLTYDGNYFNPNKLLLDNHPNKREGSAQLKKVMRIKFRDVLNKLKYKYDSESEVRIISKVLLTECKAIPTCYLLTKEEVRHSYLTEGCETIFIHTHHKNRTSKFRDDIVEATQHISSNSKKHKFGIHLPKDERYNDKAESLKAKFPMLTIIRD